MIGNPGHKANSRACPGRSRPRFLPSFQLRLHPGEFSLFFPTAPLCPREKCVPPCVLLSLALLLPAAPPRAAGPQLERGDELTYTGTITEAIDRPGYRFRRAHDLELRVFVLNRTEKYADAAVLTLLRRTEDEAVADAVPVVTGRNPNRKPAPPAARLDLVRIHEDGTAHLILPPAPRPLQFAADTPSRTLPPVPLDTFAPFEFGMFPPRPRSEESWTIASAHPARPDQTWYHRGFDFINASRCAKLLMVQLSPDWEKPRGGQTSWQRVDAVWVSTLDGTARRVHRVIRQRDGIGETPAVLIEAKYELQDQARLIGRTYDRYRQEIETAYAAEAELAALLKTAEQTGPRPFEVRLSRLDAYLEESRPGTPYREAVLTIRRQYEAARRGNITTVPMSSLPERLPPESSTAEDLRAPDLQAGAFHLRNHRGKPVVLVFFRPGMETTDLSLTIAAALRRKYGERIAVAPLVVFGTVAAAEKDCDRLKLDVPLHDGTAAERSFGIDTFPRFIVIDPAGRIHWTFAGVGAETGYLVCEQIDHLLGSRAGTVVPAGTAYPTAPAAGPVRPRP